MRSDLGQAALDPVSVGADLDALAQFLLGVPDDLRELPVDEVRGRGLMLAFDADEARELASRALLEQRLVVNATGPRTIRLLPPLTVTDDEIDDALGRLRALFGAA